MHKRLLWVILPVLAAAGCATHTRPAPGISTAVEADPRFEAVWQATLDVLQEYRFRIDRRDRRAGVITTHPLLGRHGLEFWRKDATTWREVLEGTLQTVYRAVTVRILPDPDYEGRYVTTVTVEVSRPGRQEAQIITAGEAYDQFVTTYETEETRRRELEQARARALREQAEDAEDLARADEDLGVIATSTKTGLARELAERIRRTADRRLNAVAESN